TVTGVQNLIVNGTALINTSTITTIGTQLYRGNVTLGTDATLTGTTVTFNGQVIGGTKSLDVEANAVFGDAVGDTVTGVQNMIVNGSALSNTSTITTIGTQLYRGNVTLVTDATLAGTTVTFNDQVIGGTKSLDVEANAVFGDAVGDTVTGVQNLSVEGTSLMNTSTITTIGTQLYRGNVTLGTD